MLNDVKAPAAWTPGTASTPDERLRRGTAWYEYVMRQPAPAGDSVFAGAGLLPFAFAEVWARPGLDLRARRFITLTCVGAADAETPIREHVYAALASGEITPLEMGEFVLHFAVYLGWPKASFLQSVIAETWARLQAERGTDEPYPSHFMPTPDTSSDPVRRDERGAAWFAGTMTSPAPPPNTPYYQAGIRNFVFGEMWCRPGLDMVSRRWITLACVGAADTVVPIRSHVYAALKSGDISLEQMEEFVLQFALHSGWPKASFMQQVVAESWQRCQEEAKDPQPLPVLPPTLHA